MSSAATDPARSADPQGRTRGIAAALMGLEVLGLLGVASALLLRLGVPGAPSSLITGLAVFLAIFAVLLALAALSLLRGGRFGIGWGITWQLFQALVAANLLRSAFYLVGGLGLVLAVAVFVLCLRLVRSTPGPFDQDPGARSRR